VVRSSAASDVYKRQTLLNLAFARFVGAIFGSYFREFQKKQKQDQKQLGIRFAHELFFSLRSI
jgi:hypothetical protein